MKKTLLTTIFLIVSSTITPCFAQTETPKEQEKKQPQQQVTTKKPSPQERAANSKALADRLAELQAALDLAEESDGDPAILATMRALLARIEAGPKTPPTAPKKSSSPANSLAKDNTGQLVADTGPKHQAVANKISDDDKKKLVENIRSWSQKDQMFHVKVQQLEGNKTRDLGGTRAVVVSSSKALEPFEGELNLYRRKNAGFVAQSVGTGMKVGLCLAKGRLFRETLFEDESVDTDALGGEISALTRFIGVAKELKTAKVEEVPSKVKDVRIFRAKLSANYLPGPRDRVSAVSSSRPLELVLTLKTSTDFVIHEIVATIVRSDPSAAIRGLLPSGGTRVQITSDDLDKLKDVKGPRTKYRLRPIAMKPTPQHLSLEKRVQVVLDEGDF